MRSKSFRQIVRAAIAAGVIATCSTSSALATWKDALHALPTSCVLHDLDWEFTPLTAGPPAPRFHPDATIAPAILEEPEDRWAEMRYTIESNLCLEYTRRFAIQQQIRGLEQSIAREAREWIDSATVWMHRYDRWHDAWIASLRDPGPTIADIMRSLEAPVALAGTDAANVDPCGVEQLGASTDRQEWDTPFYCLHEPAATQAQVSVTTSDIDTCDDWDCSARTRSIGVLHSGNRANIFVFRLDVPSLSAEQQNIDDHPLSSTATHGRRWQTGLDPICPEVQRAVTPWSPNPYGMPYACIFDSEPATSFEYVAGVNSTDGTLDLSDLAMEFRPKGIDHCFADLMSRPIHSSRDAAGQATASPSFDYGISHCTPPTEPIVPSNIGVFQRKSRPTSNHRIANFPFVRNWLSSLPGIDSVQHWIHPGRLTELGGLSWGWSQRFIAQSTPWLERASAISLTAMEPTPLVESAYESQPFEKYSLHELLSNVYPTVNGVVVVPNSPRVENDWGNRSTLSKALAKNLRSLGTVLIDVAKNIDGASETAEVAGRDSNQR